MDKVSFSHLSQEKRSWILTASIKTFPMTWLVSQSEESLSCKALRKVSWCCRISGIVQKISSTKLESIRARLLSKLLSGFMYFYMFWRFQMLSAKCNSKYRCCERIFWRGWVTQSNEPTRLRSITYLYQNLQRFYVRSLGVVKFAHNVRPCILRQWHHNEGEDIDFCGQLYLTGSREF